MRLTVSEAASCLTGGEIAGPAGTGTISAVRTDSRALQPGDLFVCLVGERFDGHDFAEQASRLGAAAIVVSRRVECAESACPIIQVPDTLAALGRLARCWRDRYQGRVAAVTGTAGKTTVKELAAQTLENILAARGGGRKDRVAKNHKNFNNQVGLPLSILAATGAEDAWIMEVGISKPHDMDELGVVVAPDVALVLNIGPAHLEGLGSLAGVAQAKASLLRHAQPREKGGTALCSMDYPELWTAAKAFRPDVVGFSAKDVGARYFARFVQALEDGRGRFEISVAGERVSAVLPACGAHFAENAAAVAALCHTLGHSAAEIAAGLDGCELPEQRFRCSMRGGWCVVDDTYNANPLSMARSIEAARLMAGEKPLVLVLGEMRELGGGAQQAHVDLGRMLPGVAPAAVFFKGDHAADVQRGAGELLSVTRVDNPAQVLEGLRAIPGGHGVVLVKGSRSLRMEEYAQAVLCGGLSGRAEGGSAQ